MDVQSTHDPARQDPARQDPARPDHALRGRALRYLLVDLLNQVGEASLAELTAELTDRGHTFDGRASKVVSDALRWEVRRGLVEQSGRGRYAIVRTNSATTYSSRLRRGRALRVRSLTWLAGLDNVGFESPNEPPWVENSWLSAA